MRTVCFDVDYFDTVKDCMIQCLKVQQSLKEQKITVDIVTKKDQYNHIRFYEIVFKSDDDYNVYQFIK